MRQAFTIGSAVGALLYRRIPAFWDFDLDLSDSLAFMPALPTGKDFKNLHAAGQVYAQ
jgi:hypothetical protein